MELYHKFYLKSKKEQNLVLFGIGMIASMLNLGVLIVAFMSGMWLLPILSVAITLSVIAPFFDTPSLKEHGKLIYYSPLFLAENERGGVVTVHGGTLFDYLYVLDRSQNGKQRTNSIIISYLEGILKLIETYEGKDHASVKVRGTTYILNERTAQRIGFRKVETDVLQKLLLVYNYIQLTLSNSIAKAKLSFPNLKQIHTFEASMSDLIRRKKLIIELDKKLKKQLPVMHK
ncbi:hypothetical protein D770_25780 [Flammeovirgaceae bacterium 311]|nr:hypothetical protein D770_25780 [Flammeovirgaceae bacterium 311]